MAKSIYAPEVMRKRFHEATAEQAKAEAAVKPLQDKREAILAKIAPLEAQLAEVNKQLAEARRPVAELARERGVLARALGGKTGTSAEH